MTLLHQAAQKAVTLTDEQIERLAIQSGLDEELWFGKYTPAGYEDTLPKLRRFLESALQQQPEPVATVTVETLRQHWLHAMECDHAAGRDKPHCACSLVDLGWHPSVGAAVEAWLAHVSGVSPALQLQEEPPPECKTEEEKRAFAFGWWKAMEANRASCTGAYAFGVQEVPREPVADEQDCETCHGEGTIDERLGGYWFSNPAATCPDCDGTGRVTLAASPSTTRQQEDGNV